MHINNPDALKTWLTEVLEPLCDADPAALARYVLALLKKDKPEKDLRDCMKEQLDVFLAHETESFLERLFRSIKCEDYIKIVQAKEAAAAAATAAAAAAASEAAAAAQQTISLDAPAQSQSVTQEDTNHSNSKIRIKREFTPPLHESNNSNIKSSKDSLSGTVSSGEKSSIAASTNNNSNAVHESINEQSVNTSSGPVLSANNNQVSNQSVSNSSAKNSAKSSSNKDEHSKESRNRGRRISNRSRSRSRSRSFERSRESRRSRSRDRGPLRGESNRDKANRQYRSNKSPVGRGGETFRNRYERKNHNYENRRGAGNSGGSGNGNSSGGSLAASGGSGASRTANRSQSGSRSPSPVADRRKMARSESPVTAASSASSAVAATPAVEHAPSTESGPLNAKRQRCRDFDEKGYCMRGETCPWDHGVDPVVLEDINNPALITIQSAAQMRTGPIHPEYSPDAPELWNRPPNFPPGRPSIAQRLGNISGAPGFGPRNALSGAFRGVAPGFPTGFPGNPIGATPLQRELISVPVVDANKGGDVSAQQQKRRFEPEDAVAIADAHLKRKMPLNNRLGPRITGHPAGNGGIVNPQQNCSLELRKIPRGLNAIAHLNNHFSKFGKIVNIQISYDGDPEAAIVTFSTHAEANVAYRSTEAVLNNRFIKVFWHSATVGGEQPAITPGAKTEHSLRRSYPNQYSINNNLNITSAVTTPTTAVQTIAKDGTPTSIANASSATSLASGGENVAPTTVVAAHLTTATKLINTATTPIVTANQIRMKNAAKINHAKSDLMRKTQEITQGLRKRKCDLLQGYLKELRTLVMMVEKFEAHDPSRAKLLSSIKELEGKIDKLKAEIASDQSQIVAQVAPKRKTKEQHEKEILDAELELIAQEQRTHRVPGSGNAPAPVVVSGTAPVSKPQLYGPQGNRAVRATNRVAPLGSTSVDRRPTTIAITGFSMEDADALLGHFKHFGEITKHTLDETVPSLSITYSIRQNAEKALVRGKMFRDVTLQVGWAVLNNTNISNNQASAGVGIAPTTTNMASPVNNAAEVDGISKVAVDTAEKMDDTVGEHVGATVGAETSSATSLDTLNETASMEETSEVQLVEEEEEEEDMESEDRSWRR